jgi:hypothetical protein
MYQFNPQMTTATKSSFCTFGQATINAIIFWFFETFWWIVAFQWDATRSVWTHGSKIMRFLRFQPKFRHVVSHYQCSKICPNLPKANKLEELWNATKNWDFSVFQKLKNLCVKEALEHVFTISIFNPRIFHMLFLLSKIGLCMWISAYPLVEIDDFLKVSHLVWAWDFVDMYLTHLGIRTQGGTFHIYLKKWFFWTKRLLCSLDWGKKNFFFSFECYDLANGKEWECKIW